MASRADSGLARAMTLLVVVLAVLLLAYGVARYGLSVSVRQRFWDDVLGRLHGPMTFRFFLQPIMAFLAALPDGLADARHGRSAFFWAAWRDPAAKTGRLREGLESTARIILLGLSMDVVYQWRVFDEFYPGEALMMALLLALVPYFIFRWIVERIARGRVARETAGGS